MISSNYKFISTTKFKINSITKRLFLHSISSYKSKEDIDKYETCKIYSSPDIEEFKSNKEFSNSSIIRKNWENNVLNSNFKAKYFALIPIYIQNTFSVKNKSTRFIIEMSLIPELKMLKMKSVEASGIMEINENLEDVIPITIEDYTIRKGFNRSSLPDFIDTDMIYMNKKTMNTFCFDKLGTWHKEGLNHECLQLKNSFNEKKWFDNLYWDYEWIA